jgi:AraC family transcriptional regulator of adaptative response / DNA-3-methyladenine glycosylase II
MLDAHTCYEAVVARDARYDGVFFTCARTTRVYCRPICPANPPRFANCFFVKTAAAAHEAGYRPCLRCRPESAPDVAAWRGTSAVVSRAMRLIENGALDTGGVAELAGRVGLGERHLRRLFAQHVGASPISVAQTRRLLLAKQLIHQTLLPMTEVALASGFGSVRRFNETFQALFQKPPAALRGAASDEVSSQPGISLLMSYRPPYDWEAMLSFLSDRVIPGTEAVRDGRYYRVFIINGSPGFIEVANVRKKHALEVTVHIADLSHLSDILSRVRRLFDLRSDPVAIDAALMRSADLAPLVRNRPGVRIPGAWDDCELYLATLLECRFGREKAAALMTSIAKVHGTHAQIDERRHMTCAYPFPELLRSDLEIKNIDGPSERSGAFLNRALMIARRLPEIFQSRVQLAKALGRLLKPAHGRNWAEEYLAMRVIRDVEACPMEVRPKSADHGPPAWQSRANNFEKCRPWLSYVAAHCWLDDASKSFSVWRRP